MQAPQLRHCTRASSHSPACHAALHPFPLLQRWEGWHTSTSPRPASQSARPTATAAPTKRYARSRGTWRRYGRHSRHAAGAAMCMHAGSGCRFCQGHLTLSQRKSTSLTVEIAAVLAACCI